MGTLDVGLPLALVDFTRVAGRGEGEAINRGNLRNITAVVPVKELLDEDTHDVAKHSPDRLVLDFGTCNGDGILKNADALEILIKNGVDTLCLPQIILRGAKC